MTESPRARGGAPSATVRLRTTGPDDTRAIAAALAAVLVPGDVVALSGELGAGKTCFVQGAAAALGVREPVTSPTFVLVRQYLDARIPVVHGDVYRLDRLRDVLDLGDEMLAPDVVTFVEWGDAVRALLPDDRFEVELRHGTPEGGEVEDVDAPRGIALQARGRTADRLPALRAAVEAWIVEAG